MKASREDKRTAVRAAGGAAAGCVGRAVALLRRRLSAIPRVAIQLGSGFASVLDSLQGLEVLDYDEIPGFPRPAVPGHTGRLVHGTMAGVPVLVLAGRAHYYEGHSLEAVTNPVRVLAGLGIEILVLTNAAGGIAPRYRPGDFMVLRDHINLMGANPLRGVGGAAGEGFVDLSNVYDEALRRRLVESARAVGARVHTGVYLAVSGPSYETPAEIRAFARLGADAVGMSTVPEAVVARQRGLRVAAIACIANLAAGRRRGRIDHADVLEEGRRQGRLAAALLAGWVRRIGVRQQQPQE
ncbi:MAG TPA: purine-nucleoside phosphorylase [Verrucomicrobiota bacterium]|nr:purine-nucleoside phosphorylase [Verrucomicrobiota bacterium]